MPETGINDAVLAERFRTHVEEMALLYQDIEVKVTISLGVSEFTAAGSPEMLLQKAAEALYEAKETGRNKVRSKP